jgi:hypothetical protein
MRPSLTNGLTAQRGNGLSRSSQPLGRPVIIVNRAQSLRYKGQLHVLPADALVHLTKRQYDTKSYAHRQLSAMERRHPGHGHLGRSRALERRREFGDELCLSIA